MSSQRHNSSDSSPEDTTNNTTSSSPSKTEKIESSVENNSSSSSSISSVGSSSSSTSEGKETEISSPRHSNISHDTSETQNPSTPLNTYNKQDPSFATLTNLIKDNKDFAQIVNIKKQQNKNRSSISFSENKLALDTQILNQDDPEYLLQQLLICKSQIALSANADNEFLDHYYSVEKTLNDCRPEFIKKAYFDKLKKDLTDNQVKEIQKKRFHNADTALQLFKLFQTDPPVKYKPILYKQLLFNYDLIVTQYQSSVVVVHNNPPSPVKTPTPKKKKFYFF